MLCWYFLGAALAAGSAISSGLFVPMLMMGALVGRLVGLATTDIADKYGALLTSELVEVCLVEFCLRARVSTGKGMPAAALCPLPLTRRPLTLQSGPASARRATPGPGSTPARLRWSAQVG